ncbi:hypothetical protein AC481_04960 [miscellaneous Crenarchaeota group archaeon SMTZ-80]|nr:MAG: hypothetical protein AC481_04960 [miscellaneous Crenarchaeota group archaeon SMTZ-80]
MKQIISRCGNICSECPWSTHMRKKIAKEDWDEYSKQIKYYIGFKPVKYEWEGCVGCFTPNNELPSHPFFNFLKKCRTRKCGQHNEIPNCAYCRRFPCANTVARNNITREKISEKLGKEIIDNEYEPYIKMFDAMENLNEIRNKLNDTQIKNPKPVFYKREITKLTGEFNNEGFKFVYVKLLEIANSNLKIKGIDTVAGLEMYKIREDFLWRFLWIVVLFGEIDGNKLRIDSATLYDNRKPISLPSNEEGWNLYFDILSEFNVSVELEILTDNLYTPGGYMRAKTPKTNEPAYIIKMKGGSDLQKLPFFKVMNEMLLELQKKTGKLGFSNFKKLNFNPLLD